MTQTAADLLPKVELNISPITEAERTGAMSALEPILDRYGTSVERVPRANLAQASSVLLRAHAHATAAAQRARWFGLPAPEFDVGCLEALRPLAVGCRDVRAAVQSWDAQTSLALVPRSLAAETVALKQRVMRYVDYQLGQEPAMAQELADIRSGTGYLDLESDLRRLAVAIESHQPILAQDRFFQADDAATCRRLADALAAELATEAGQPVDWLNRVHVAIYRCYHLEVLPTAAWLYRSTPSALAFYPSVYAVGRRTAVSAEPGDTVVEETQLPETP